MQTDGRTATYGRRETTLIGYAPAPSTPQATVYQGESQRNDSAPAEPTGEQAETLVANLAGALEPAPTQPGPPEEAASQRALTIEPDEHERLPEFDALQTVKPGDRRNPMSRRLPINRGRHLSRAFFEEGERQEQKGWEDSPLATDPSLSGSGELGFSSFDQLPRRRAPMIALAVGATTALVVVGALTFGARSTGSPGSGAVSPAREVRTASVQAAAPSAPVLASPVQVPAPAPAQAPASASASMPASMTARAPVAAPPPAVISPAAVKAPPPVAAAAPVARPAPVVAAPVKSHGTTPGPVKTTAPAPVRAAAPAVAIASAGKVAPRAFVPTADARGMTKPRAQVPRVVGPAASAKTGRQAASARRAPAPRAPVANTVPARLRMKSPPAPAQTSAPAATAAPAAVAPASVEVNTAAPEEASAAASPTASPPAEAAAPPAPAAAAPVELPPASAAPAAPPPEPDDVP